jgi:mitochondrial fission protein ELM1
VDVKQILMISDGKPGHRNQSLGLAEAIARQRPVRISERGPLGWLEAVRLCFGAAPAPTEPPPDLLIAAGHATHLTLLALGKLYRAPAIVLMKPSLPLSCFDLCLVPEHDRPPKRANVIATQGALNRMRPGSKRAGSGMILIGGPSRHYGWDEARVLAQVDALLSRAPRAWRISSSRRTPAATERALAERFTDRFVAAATTGPDWLPRQLAQTEVCWVTEDSVSMVYEALTAGCRVGVLPVGAGANNRMRRGLERLAAQGRVAYAPDWSLTGLGATATAFNEAERCAAALLERGWI